MVHLCAYIYNELVQCILLSTDELCPYALWNHDNGNINGDSTTKGNSDFIIAMGMEG